MTVLKRYRQLKADGVVDSWAQLKRLQRLHDFPLGRMLSPNIRVWTTEEVDKWIAERPTENVRPLRGTAKRRVEAAAERVGRAREAPGAAETAATESAAS